MNDMTSTRAESVPPKVRLGYRLLRRVTSLRYNYRGRDRLLRVLCPQDGRDVPFEVVWRGLRYRGNLDNVIDYATFFYGAFAKGELAVLERIAKFLAFSGQPPTFLDVGTNVGSHALFMSAFAKQVVGFEPVAELRRRALDNIELNKLGNIIVMDCALGEDDADREIYCSESVNLGCNSLIRGFASDNSSTGRTIRVRNGDQVVAASQLKNVKIVKIDVEGYEPQVCCGLAETFRRERPFILMELWGANVEYFARLPRFPNCLYPGSTAYKLVAKNNGWYELTPYELTTHRGQRQEEVLIVPDEARGFIANNSVCKYLA